MAYNQLLFGLTVSVIFFSKGCHSQLSDCGVVPIATRAPGADANSPGNWPWLVGINNGSHHFCSGSLINKQWVLTSAYCVSRVGSTFILVDAGLYNQSLPLSIVTGGVAVLKRCHPGYDNETAENDICLLKLSAPFDFSAIVRPVCLADEDSVFHTGEYSWVPAPHGVNDMDEEGSSTSKALQVLKVPVVGNNECRCTYGSLVTKKIVCAGPRADDDDDDDGNNYEGDLGAPLIAKNNNSWVQFGIVSFGSDWSGATTPRGYTRVSEYQDWIAGIVGNSSLTGFIQFTSEGVDSDLDFTSTTHIPPTGGRDDDTIFDGGSMTGFSHFTHLASMCSLALYLLVSG